MAIVEGEGLGSFSKEESIWISDQCLDPDLSTLGFKEREE
jgi:hypothetical protein